MDTQEGPVEAAAHRAWQEGEFDTTARVALQGYGSELYSFLLAQFKGSGSEADEVFSDFSEDLWRGLPSFQWRCSLRAWCYKLARNACSRYWRSPHNRPSRHLGLSGTSALADLAELRRSTTQLFQQTQVKDRFAQLREQLTRDDQDLLILRVDRELSWRDVAHAMGVVEGRSDDDDLSRTEAAFRQRFTEVKRRLRKLAVSAGLIME